MNQTINDERIIGENDIQEIHTYVDLSNELHIDMRGHTVEVSTFSIGVLTLKSSKYNISSKSSNEL